MWMPLYVGDYLRDTTRLTLPQHGGYLLLIMDYWISGPLPDDDVQLAAIVRVSVTEWQKSLRPRLSPFFQISEGRWRHKRIDQEIERATAYYEQRKIAGMASGAARRRNRFRKGIT